jgi:MinD-like ATPase involved in chromosome partitioning or flagellar assembly
MSDRQRGPAQRLAPRAVVRSVRMLSTGRWRPPLGTPPLVGRRAPRVVAIGSALPGAGKSVVASNLAAAMAGVGRQVAVVELELNAPRQPALFGVAPSAEAERPTPVRHVRLVRPAADPASLGQPDARRAALDGLAALDADVVIVDLTSARRDDLWTSFATADRLLVTTGDPAALQATYEFLAHALARAERRYGAGARAALARFSGGLIGNVATAPEDAERFHAFARMVREGLGIPITSLGCVRKSSRIAQSVMAGRPLVARRGHDDDVRLFNQLAELMSMEPVNDRGCALDGPAPDRLPPIPPVDVARYQRKHPRFVVDWAATLLTAEGPNAVRVCDVSQSGAAIETTLKLGVGDSAALCFYQLDGQPTVDVVVRNVVPGMHRIGLAFVGAAEVAAQLARTARARAAAP